MRVSGTVFYGLFAVCMASSYADADFSLGGAANFGSDPAEITVSIVDLGDSLEFTINVIPETGTGNIGDLRGFFFDVNDSSLLAGLSVSGTSVTGSEFDAGNVIDLGNGANLNGGGNYNFDAGVEFGSPGIGGNDIRIATFVLSHSSVSLDVSFVTDPGYFGVRLTSVGLEGGSRDGSSKIKGPGVDLPDDPNLTVPEPSSIVLLGMGTLGLFKLRRRRS